MLSAHANVGDQVEQYVGTYEETTYNDTITRCPTNAPRYIDESVWKMDV
jgi:hypothetical protein